LDRSFDEIIAMSPYLNKTRRTLKEFDAEQKKKQDLIKKVLKK